MKRPKPRDYGLDSDHPAPNAPSVRGLRADPAQPFTQEELHYALTLVVESKALEVRQAVYADAVENFNYNNGGR